jgi:thymidylate kinase
MKIGELIVFEGADEVGKTMLASMLAEAFGSKGIPCEVVGFPGNKVGTLGRHVNELHHYGSRFQVDQINPTSLQFLHIAAHIDTIDRQILPSLARKRIVILDRFWWSAWIYGSVNHANKNSLKAAIQGEAIHWHGIRPARLFLVTAPTPFEKQSDLQKWKRIDHAYKKFAAQEKQKYPVTVIRNDSTPEEALFQVQKHLKAL